MAESFDDSLKRLSDQLIRSSEEFDRRLRKQEEQAHKSREEFDQRLREEDERAQKSREEFDQRLRKQEEQAQKSREEFDQRLRKQEEQTKQSHEAFQRDLKASQEAFDRDLKASREEWDRYLKASQEHNKQRMDELNKALGGIGNVQGEIAEDLFRRNAEAALNHYGIPVDAVHHHLKAPGMREYDVVAVNGSEAVVFEIKNKLRPNDVETFLRTQLPQFKTAFPQYENYTVYGGMGALVISQEQEAELCALGLFVLTQSEDGIAHVKGPKNPIVL